MKRILICLALVCVATVAEAKPIVIQTFSGDKIPVAPMPILGEVIKFRPVEEVLNVYMGPMRLFRLRRPKLVIEPVYRIELQETK